MVCEWERCQVAEESFKFPKQLKTVRVGRTGGHGSFSKVHLNKDTRSVGHFMFMSKQHL
jgi:hypothetical protein